MTVITKPSIEKKDKKALLDESEKLPEVTVTQPKESIKILAKKKVVRRQSSGDNACSTIFTFLIATGIVIGLSYFSLHVYKKKWLERRGSGRTWTESQMQQIDPFEFQSEPVSQKIAWISTFMLFDGRSLIIGGFDDLNARIKTSQEMDRIVDIEHKTLEVDKYVQTPYMTGLTLEYEEELEAFEMLQMPELFSGRYVHDFSVKKTLIIDSDNDRCFITDLDENEIQKPRNICQMIRGINEGGVYEMDLEEVRKETYAIEIEKDNVTSTVYGCPITTMSRNSCDKFYQLYDVHDKDLDEILEQDYGLEIELEDIKLSKRSVDDTNKEYAFVEFAGKSLVKTNIVNAKDLF